MQDKSTEPKMTSIEWERGDGVQSTLRVPTCDELLDTLTEHVGEPLEHLRNTQ
jgi:hypothetical protein